MVADSILAVLAACFKIGMSTGMQESTQEGAHRRQGTLHMDSVKRCIDLVLLDLQRMTQHPQLSQCTLSSPQDLRVNQEAASLQLRTMLATSGGQNRWTACTGSGRAMPRMQMRNLALTTA